MVGVRNDASPERFVSLCLSNITNPNQIKATLLIKKNNNVSFRIQDINGTA